MRYPNEFNGIVAVSAGLSLPRAALAQAWDAQSFAALVKAPGEAQLPFARLAGAFSDSDLQLVREVKGWPDKKAAIGNVTHAQELFYERLSVRLKDLVLRSGLDDARWNESTSTAKVHERLGDGWNEDEEQALQLCDNAYARKQSENANLQSTADPPALDGPFTMVKRDPELLSAWNRLESTIRDLNRELSLESS